MKEDLCKAFCQDLNVREVPVGLAVGTGFRLNNGDSVGFYVTYQNNEKNFGRIEDDGLTIGSLEAAGINLSNGPRADQFLSLMSQFGISLDQDEVVLHSASMPVEKLPVAALNFVSFIIRVQELTNWTREVIEATFRHDVIESIKKHFSGRAQLHFGKQVDQVFPDVPVDAAIVPPVGLPMAVFIGTSEAKGLEAMLLWSDIRAEMAKPAKIMLVVDTAKTKRVSDRTYARAINRFPVAVFSGHKQEAMEAIERNLFDRGVAHDQQAIH